MKPIPKEKTNNTFSPLAIAGVLSLFGYDGRIFSRPSLIPPSLDETCPTKILFDHDLEKTGKE